MCMHGGLRCPVGGPEEAVHSRGLALMREALQWE